MPLTSRYKAIPSASQSGITIYQGAEHAFRKASGYAEVFNTTLTASQMNGQNYIVREIEIETTIAAEDTSGTNIGVMAVYDGVNQAAYENAGGYTGIRSVTWRVPIPPSDINSDKIVSIQASSDAAHGIFVRTLLIRASVVDVKV